MNSLVDASILYGEISRDDKWSKLESEIPAKLATKFEKSLLEQTRNQGL